MPIIIVEGFDDTGKTTLAKKLAKHFGYEYVSGGGPEMSRPIPALARLLSHENKVQDRTWISDIVYGPILRGKTDVTDRDMMELIKVHKERKIRLIYARRPFDSLMKTIGNRDQLEGVIDQAKALFDRYEYYMTQKLPIYLPRPIVYNFEHMSFEEVVQALLNYSFEIIPPNIKSDTNNQFIPGGPSLTDN